MHIISIGGGGDNTSASGTGNISIDASTNDNTAPETPQLGNVRFSDRSPRPASLAIQEEEER